MSAAAVGATTVLLEEIRARRERDEKAWADRQYKRAASKADRQRQDLFEEGRREERSRTKRSSTSRPASGRKTSTRSSTRRRRAPATARTATRQLAQPVRAQTVSAMYAFGLTLAVVATYQVLRHASAVEGALGGLARGLEWLSAPDKSIPYAGSS